MAVSVVIYVEGGVIPGEAVAEEVGRTQIGVASNTEKFRESFSKLLQQRIDSEKVNVFIQPGGGVNQSVNIFKASKMDNPMLVIDLDGPPSSRADRLQGLDIEEHADSVFFMVQEMEAWFLAQPSIIDQYYENFHRIIQEPFPEYEDPESISRPSRELNIQVQRFYVDPSRLTRKGRPKKVKYGKLKDAPGMILLLDINDLEQKFDDVASLLEKLELLQTYDEEE